MPVPETDDLKRLRQEYADREHRLDGSDIYSPFKRANLFTVQNRQRAALDLLQESGFSSLDGKHILEIGCGNRNVLREFLSTGANPSLLHGTDLIFKRANIAYNSVPDMPLTCADGQNLPYASNTFDLVLQYTVFSSIQDDQIKKNLASEMIRMLKPEGIILWYDFWINPTNPQARGIRLKEIRSLFQNCDSNFRRITLAPPISRRLAHISWPLCTLLEGLSILNTHYLVAISRKSA